MSLEIEDGLEDHNPARVNQHLDCYLRIEANADGLSSDQGIADFTQDLLDQSSFGTWFSSDKSRYEAGCFASLNGTVRTV